MIVRSQTGSSGWESVGGGAANKRQHEGTEQQLPCGFALCSPWTPSGAPPVCGIQLGLCHFLPLLDFLPSSMFISFLWSAVEASDSNTD